MVGGLVTSTVLTLVIIPVIYTLWRGRELNRNGYNSFEEEQE